MVDVSLYKFNKLFDFKACMKQGRPSSEYSEDGNLLVLS